MAHHHYEDLHDHKKPEHNTIGAGASGYNPSYSPGSFGSNASGKGNDSSIAFVSSTITATGGGGGGVGECPGGTGDGGDGGSGGGGNGGWGTCGGSGNTPPTSQPKDNQVEMLMMHLFQVLDMLEVAVELESVVMEQDLLERRCWW